MAAVHRVIDRLPIDRTSCRHCLEKGGGLTDPVENEKGSRRSGGRTAYRLPELIVNVGVAGALNSGLYKILCCWRIKTLRPNGGSQKELEVTVALAMFSVTMSTLNR